MTKDVEVVELATVEEASIGRSFWSSDPAQMMETAGAQAQALADIIDKQSMSTNIRGKKHINIEGWQTLGAMVGVFAVIDWSRELVDLDGKNLGWEARAEARTADGNVVGAAEAECRRTESTWKSRDSYALRSMAQTRAMSKALRGPLGFIVHIAGYSATPEEEMVPVLSPYAQAGKHAVAIMGDKNKAKAAFMEACEANEITPTSKMTDSEADLVMATLDELNPEEAKLYYDGLVDGNPYE